MINILEIGDSRIAYKNNPGIHIYEYYNYVLDMLKDALKELDTPVNIVFGNLNEKKIKFDVRNMVIRMDIQYEHTLVKDGGRSVDEKIFGVTPLMYEEEGTYLVRIPDYDHYSKQDITIEYSLPNIYNIIESAPLDPRLLDYARRTLYIPAVIYDEADFGDPNNKAEIFTLFSSNPSPRRAKVSRLAKSEDLNVSDVKDVFSKEDLKKIYQKSKVMVNVHQTDHHHTFEELRCLPAIANGVIIVSEDVPNKKRIPYYKSIMWCKYENLIETVDAVQYNYKHYYKKLFTNSLKHELNTSRKVYTVALKNKISQAVTRRTGK